MSDPGDGLRRLADVVDVLQETPVTVDGARLLEDHPEEIRAQLTVTVSDDVDVGAIIESPSVPDVDVHQNESVSTPEDSTTEDASEDSDDDEAWCGRCGYGPSSEVGVARHHGQKHTGAASVLEEPPDELKSEDPDGESTDETDEDLTAERVFAELLAMVEDDGYGWVKSKDLASRLGTTGQKIGHRLRTLREDGLVEKHNVNAAVSAWRPTEQAFDGDNEKEDADTDENEDDPFVRASNKRKQNDKRDRSTEDDTHQTESEAEAQDVGLEETDADDAPVDAGDDVQEESDDPEPITVDAVNDPDDPDETELELPDGVTTADVEAAVGELETLGDVGEEIGVTRGRARTITVALGCYGDVQDLPAGGR